MSRFSRAPRLRMVLFFLSLFLIYSFHQHLGYWMDSRSFLEQPLDIFDPAEYSYHHSEDAPSLSWKEAEEDIIEVKAPVSPAQSPFCQSYECGKGKWTPRRNPFTSLEHFQSAHSNSYHPVWYACDLWNAERVKAEGEENMKRAGQRLVDMMNWEWLPDRGKLLEYDPIEFVVRMLKSPGGLILVGGEIFFNSFNNYAPTHPTDSITRQHWHAFYVHFLHHDITYHSNPEHLPLAGTPSVDQFVLKKNSPMYKVLQEKAGVPDSRMERPFFTIMEEHMGIGEADIRAITNVKPDFEWAHKFRRIEGWEDHMKWLATPREGEEDSVTEDTLVMINAGAHWSRQELPMLRAPTEIEEKALLTDAYARMNERPSTTALLRLVTQVVKTLVRHTKTWPTQGLKNNFLYNVSKTKLSLDGEKLGRSRWDWDEFKHHNEMWNSTIQSIMEERPEESKDAKWYYLDVWDLSLQRPEAHLEPPQDCLHWCLPTVFDDWTKLFYHTVNIEEGRQ
ncbi:hypothetical protein BT96DRAFT_984574 [Gymnopus androsaceus JB14]|uniref:Trichome birefringence-like C-terminal domain-containing protein n=1 Tax=Gymnopus androsaceus JB14 TaxID=1447944 RepID=A0A6A4IIJ8_9AGAR|nr:hypothetical protein BT96DRAFT_984574 [Gymnopus androsaceus JB14]